MKTKQPLLCKLGRHNWSESRVATETRRICLKCKLKNVWTNGVWKTVNSFVFRRKFDEESDC